MAPPLLKDNAGVRVLWRPHIPPTPNAARRVDPETGAPVNSQGARECKVRTLTCDSASMKCDPSIDGLQVPAGPDGIPNPCTFVNNVETPNCPFSGHYSGDAATILSQRSLEDQIPSVGNCLLFDNPETESDRQSVRNPAMIALDHSANQTLFHTLCTLWFDPLTGSCSLDYFTHPYTWHLVSDALGTGALTTFISPNSLTMQSVGFPNTGFSLFSFEKAIFANSQLGSALSLSQESAETQALLGCGPHFLWPCDSSGFTEMTQDFAYMCSSGVPLQNPEACAPTIPGNFVDGLPTEPPAETRFTGGFAPMNGSGDVATQEFSIRKVRDAAAAIGTTLGDCPADRKHGGQCFLPGIKLPDPAANRVATDFSIEGMTLRRGGARSAVSGPSALVSSSKRITLLA